MPVLAPAGELLSFVSPKESNPRKGDPDAACFLRSSLLNGVPEGASQPLHARDASLHRPFRAIPSKSSGARRGKRDKTRPTSHVEVGTSVSVSGKHEIAKRLRLAVIWPVNSFKNLPIHTEHSDLRGAMNGKRLIGFH